MDPKQIRPGMKVIEADGRELGIVISLLEDGFVMRGGGTEGRVLSEHVTRVDNAVHLDRRGISSEGAAAAGASESPAASGSSPAWLWPSVIGAVAVVLLLLALSRCNGRDEESTRTETTTTTRTAGSDVIANSDQAMLPALQAFLTSHAATPKTFTFDKLNFDTNEATIRTADRQTIEQVADVLKAILTLGSVSMGTRTREATHPTMRSWESGARKPLFPLSLLGE